MNVLTGTASRIDRAEIASIYHSPLLDLI